jgi:uncharacterized caspase-like protein
VTWAGCGRLASAIPFLLTVAAAAESGSRKALLIGNASYTHVRPLPAASNDARLFSKLLAGLQFDTHVVENLNLDALEQTLQKFALQIGPGDVSLVFYAGYGLQSGGENYLLGVEFDPAKPAEIDYTAYSMRRALNDLEARRASLNIMLFDAAYDDPALRKRYPQPGLAPLTPSSAGSFLGFSAAPGQTAVAPVSSPVSLYARALIESLPAPAVNLAQAFALVKRRVNESSGGLQVPAEMSTVVSDFRFNPKTDEQVAWERAAAGGAAELDAFVRLYPASSHAVEARARLADLDRQSRMAGNRKLAEQALREYRQAFEQRDIERLKTVWPALTRQEISSFQDFFRIARTVTLKLDPVGEPELTEDSARWVWKRTIEATDERGRMPAQETEVTFRLKRSGERMVIDSIAVKRN